MAQIVSPSKEHEEPEEEDGLEVEVVRLRQQVCEQEGHITVLEGEILRSVARGNDLERQVITWREKYDRLYDSHKRVQKINQNLEDKLLHMADKCSLDKSQLARDVETLSVRLAESNYTMGGLHRENERYKNDMNLAIQLLQCKPDNFVSQKFDTLPAETQARVSSYIINKAKLNQESPTGVRGKAIPTTPEKINPDEFEFNISASLMSKILEESFQNTISKHCDTCTCLKKSSNPFSYSQSHFTVSTQTLQRPDILCNKCLSEPNPIKSGLTTICSKDLSLSVPKPSVEANCSDEKDLSSKSPDSNSIVKIVSSDSNKSPATKPPLLDIKSTAKSEETAKLVSLKHKEIMGKIGENLDEMNLKAEFRITPMEPMSGHHRLCERTKPVTTLSKTATEYFYGKADGDNKGIDSEACKPVTASPKLVSANQMADDVAITFAQIENPVTIPNLVECKNNLFPKSKADLNFIDNANNFRDNSISSNEAESKTSSSKSWKNNGSHNSSNNKVHIGPGPRFCSLRMQAGSKNILLDNAQPNIAPVLYTRQTRNLDASPSTIGGALEDDLSPPEKRETMQNLYPPSFTAAANISPMFSPTEEIAILDLPNEELPLSKPIEICEKPESGYKSNESAEIIDKLLFGVDPTLPVHSPISVTKINDLLMDPKPEIVISSDNIAKENKCILPEPTEIKTTASNGLNNIGNEKVEHFQRERRTSIHNMKVFNFDQYERNLKVQPSSKITKDTKIISPHFNAYGTAKIPGTARQVINDIVKDSPLVNNTDTNKITQKTANQITKKVVRNIANQTVPENSTTENKGEKEWKKEASTEKSSSSLSSDDSAAVLQKQQLIRVAQWVQQNMEMEHQGDAATQQAVEEMHHVRNDFPRPAKVEHTRRKKGHPVRSIPRQEEQPPGLSQVSMVMGQYCPSQITTRSYSREELARMEYNVKQFLLNGSRWTPETAHQFPPDPDADPDQRTSSKTETDL